MPEGMTSGTVMTGEGEACAYTILCDDGTKLDPTNLETPFQKSEAKVWFTYRRLRMQPRCNGITAVEIENIQMAK